MSSQLKDLIRSGSIDAALRLAAEGNEPAAKLFEVRGYNGDVDIAAAEEVIDAGGTLTFPTQARVHALVSGSANDVGGKVASGTFTFADNNVLDGTDEGTITIVDFYKANGEKATGQINITNFAALAGKTITVDDTTITEGSDFDAEVSNEKTARNIAAALAGETAVTATVNTGSAVVEIEAAAIGTAGNSIALETNAASGIALSGATLAGGKAVLTVTVDLDTFVAGTDFDAETDNDTTAANLAAAIDTTGVTATAEGAVVTITLDTNGLQSSHIALATSNTNAATISGDELAGGSDLLTLQVNGVDFVAGVDFDVGASKEDTAQNFVDALNASEDVGIDGLVTASLAGAVVTVSAVAQGTAANSYTLTSDTDSVTASGSGTMAGGRADGTGAREILVTGLDANYAEITETVVLNGTNSVNTVNSYLRINELRVTEVGSGAAAAGNITATAATDTTVTSRILAGQNVSRQAVYTVPASKTAFMVNAYAALPNQASKKAQVEVLARPYGLGYEQKDLLCVNADNKGYSESMRAISFAAKTDIKMLATVSADNSVVQAGMQLLVVKDA